MNLIDKLKSILSMLSVGENCKCSQCKAGREIEKLIKELENEPLATKI